MGMMKRFLMDVMEDMEKDEIDDDVCERANDILAHQIDDYLDRKKEGLIK